MDFIKWYFVFLLTWAFPHSGNSETPIHVGVSAPLSGEAAAFGEDIRSVLTFAKRHFGDSSINLLFQDDKCSGRDGASVASFFSQQAVRAVIGYACVEAVMPAIPILERASIPVISLLASSPDITGPKKNVFSLYPSDDLGVGVVIDRLKSTKARNILVLTASSAFPTGITDAYRKQVKDLRSVFIEYPEKSVDFRSILTKVAARHRFDAIFINYSSVEEFIGFMRQRSQLHLSGRVFTSYLNGLDEIKAQNRLELIEGVEFYDTASIEDTLQANDAKIFDAFLESNGHLKSSDGYFPFIFNGYVALREALMQKAKISDFLRTNSFTNGIGGAFHFDNNGAVSGGPTFVMKTILRGRVITLQPPL